MNLFIAHQQHTAVTTELAQKLTPLGKVTIILWETLTATLPTAWPELPQAIFFDATAIDPQLVAAAYNNFPQTVFFAYHPLQSSPIPTVLQQPVAAFNNLVNDLVIIDCDANSSLAEISQHLQYRQQIQCLQQQQRHLDNLFDTLLTVGASLERNRIIELALISLGKLFPADSCVLYVLDPGTAQFDLPKSCFPAPPKIALHLPSQPSALLTQATQNLEVILAHSTQLAQDEYYRDQQFQQLLLFPIHSNASIWGILELGQRRRTDYCNLNILTKVRILISNSLNNALHFSDLERLGKLDELTQLYNTRHLYNVLETEIKRAKRYLLNLSLLFIDLDGFKAVNDTNGHLCGSATLIEAAHLIARSVRETDLVGRYGGDEFVIVLPETSPEKAVTIAERIRQNIANTIFRGGADYQIHLTASFGVASYPENAASPAALIRAADKAMYLAKEQQKNSVVRADSLE
jgi:diguanylate cyclase (GGDEF)-like protein